MPGVLHQMNLSAERARGRGAQAVAVPSAPRVGSLWTEGCPAVRESAGPYIVSGGWWGSGTHREYHYVRTAEGPWLWIYYDRKRCGWFLHGKVE